MFSPVTRLLLLGASLLMVSSEAGDPWFYKDSENGELGPNDWKQSYPACGGQHQSPVNIPVSSMSHDDWGMEHAPLKFGGDCDSFTLKKLDDLFKWEIQGDEQCTVKSINNDGREYKLAQFHMHATSEHTLDDYHYDAEIHFVHKNADTGTILVTGVLLHAEPGVDENSFIKSLWNDLNSGNPTYNIEDSGMSYPDLLNGLVAKSHLFNYNGSLTTPPCSEVVDWWVLNNPIPISPEELDQMKEHYKELEATKDGSDNRPTQPLNDREIKYY